ncbi:type II toxin-antitoxin system MqsR family toxin [Leptospira sp. WS58.C1]|uniref:type II toxin-antitoxin system MqsR family toxin n=1 Tax=Leptospira cinconiae TaxID=3235173 RepID=UPI00349E95DC
MSEIEKNFQAPYFELNQIKEVLSKWEEYFRITNRALIDASSLFDLDIDKIKEVILSLEDSEFQFGHLTEKTKGKNGLAFDVYRKKIQGAHFDAYIKLSLDDRGFAVIAQIISFHEYK